MKKYRFIWLFVGVFILQGIKAQPSNNTDISTAELKKYLAIPSIDSLLHQTDEDAQKLIITPVEILKPESPDIPLHRARLLLLSQKIIDFAKANGNKQLELQFEIFQYSNHLQQVANKEELLAIIKKLYQKAKDDNIKWAVIITKYYLAINYMEVQQDFPKGFLLLRETLEDIEKDHLNKYLIKEALLLSLLGYHYQMGDLENAAFFGKKALHKNVFDQNALAYLHIINTLGIVYRNLNQLDTSNYYFNQIFQWATQKNDSVWIALCNGNLGENLFLQKNYDKALPMLQIDAEYDATKSDFGPASNAYLLIATIYLKKGDIQNAEIYLKKGTYCAYKFGYPYNFGKFMRLKLLYETLTQYYIATKNAQLAQMYLDSTKMFTDSITAIRSKMTSVKTEGIFQLQKSEIQNLKLNRDLETSKNKQYLFLMLLVIGFLSGALGFTQYRTKAKSKEAQLQLAREKIELDLNAAHAELEKYILQFASLPNDHDVNWKETTILTPDHWKKFQELFHNSYPDFHKRLNEQIPGLTETELRFIYLLKVKLNDAEMANVLGVNKNTIQQTRSRLRKKLNLDGNVSLTDLVEEI